MKIPYLKKKKEIKSCHNVIWEDNYSYNYPPILHYDKILSLSFFLDMVFSFNVGVI